MINRHVRGPFALLPWAQKTQVGPRITANGLTQPETEALARLTLQQQRANTTRGVTPGLVDPRQGPASRRVPFAGGQSFHCAGAVIARNGQVPPGQAPVPPPGRSAARRGAAARAPVAGARAQAAGAGAQVAGVAAPVASAGPQVAATRAKVAATGNQVAATGDQIAGTAAQVAGVGTQVAGAAAHDEDADGSRDGAAEDQTEDEWVASEDEAVEPEREEGQKPEPDTELAETSAAGDEDALDMLVLGRIGRHNLPPSTRAAWEVQAAEVRRKMAQRPSGAGEREG